MLFWAVVVVIALIAPVTIGLAKLWRWIAQLVGLRGADRAGDRLLLLGLRGLLRLCGLLGVGRPRRLHRPGLWLLCRRPL